MNDTYLISIQSFKVVHFFQLLLEKELKEDYCKDDETHFQFCSSAVSFAAVEPPSGRSPTQTQTQTQLSQRLLLGMAVTLGRWKGQRDNISLLLSVRQ